MAQQQPHGSPALPSQDLPPRGGFEPVRFRRNLPKRGPPAYAVGLGLVGLMSYGWYVMIGAIRERREMEREKVWSRYCLVPLLQAELDRDQIRREESQIAYEKQVMGSDWEEDRSYNSRRYIPPRVYVGSEKNVRSL